MRSLVPGRFASAIICGERGELQTQLSDGGNWQVRVRSAGETDWRLLCSGDLDGRVLAPAPDGPPGAVTIGPLSIDFAGRCVQVRGADCKLGQRQFDLLAYLAHEPVRVATKAELLREVWGHPEAARTRTLEACASRLRTMLREAGAEGFIINSKGVGYRLCQAVPV
ncbi:MAG TPA: winged helix-turn-helix domain-containing protein [Solirubrobacterales bacterium]|nr:winged helix-turn-helix domain-containing protein [Solirubrobacterales bacterium]